MSIDIKEKVLNMLKENLEVSEEVDIDQLGFDDDLSVLGVNSMTFIKLVIAAEMEFGMTWDDEELDFSNFSTINNIINYISSSTENQTLG
ncbi:acyl carrier protein [Chengkuizengella marina]|uniref:Acyl carrier protein n=1 Tax=Chengkuizengella marina TaxID=2507566 RepID=A0A6N9PVP3_9BACL|nr:phosphopantetheine-binding protein [Chengkuizengella marina]NBI27601.1 acyl carrier protein [Chengkuizengella marina]